MSEYFRVDCATGEASVEPLTPEQAAELAAAQEAASLEAVAVAWETVTAERDLRLMGSDWVMSPPSDTPPGTQGEIAQYKQEWETYRDELRAITEQADPTAIDWPIPPPAPSLPVTAQPDGAARLARLLE
jgi:hypothetical protein